MHELPSEYRVIDGQALIELRLSRLAQVFNSFDPAPFPERDLDDEAEAYIVACAREIPARHPFRLLVHLPPEEAASEEARQLSRIIQHYFAYRADTQRRELRQVFRHGRWSLLIGLSCLVGCLGLRMLIEWLDATHASLVSRMASESLLIVGWVAMWRPADDFLYAWHPAHQKLRVYLRLSNVAVEIRTDPAPVRG